MAKKRKSYKDLHKNDGDQINEKTDNVDELQT